MPTCVKQWRRLGSARASWPLLQSLQCVVRVVVTVRWTLLPQAMDIIRPAQLVRLVPTADTQSYGSAWLARGMVFLAVSAAIESTECRRVTRYTDLETDYDRQRARKRHAENTW
jgi:hypothetical protein